MIFKQKDKGITATEVILTVVILVTAIVLLANTPPRSHFRKGCKANLDQIGKSLKLYTIDFGRSVLYPRLNGSGFIATLYKENILVEKTVYLCPRTRDYNANVNIGTIRKEGHGYGPMSYGGRRNSKQINYPGIFRPGKYTTITTVSADDWNDGKMENHENGELVIFLFLDGHSDHVKSRGANFSNYSFNYNPLAN